MAPAWSARVDDHHRVTTDRTFRALVERVGAHLIGYRPVRVLRRKTLTPVAG